VTILGLLHVSVAFDTVHYEIILQSVKESLGASGQALKWLGSFPIDILKHVAFSRRISTLQILLQGIPKDLNSRDAPKLDCANVWPN